MKKQPVVLRAQQTVVAVTVATYLATLAQGVSMIHSYFTYSGDWRWAIWYFSLMILLPPVIFAVFWKVVKGDGWKRLSEASTLSLATYFASGVLGTLFSFVVWPYVWVYINGELSMMILNGIGLVIDAIIVGVFIWLLRRPSVRKKDRSFGRTALVITSVAFMATNVIQTVIMVAMQYRDNPNLSAYMASFIGIGVACALACAVFVAEKWQGAKRPFGTAVFVTALGMTIAYALFYVADLVSWSLLPQALLAVAAVVAALAGVYVFWWLYKTLREL
jgi:MFS family permease